VKKLTIIENDAGQIVYDVEGEVTIGSLVAMIEIAKHTILAKASQTNRQTKPELLIASGPLASGAR
jgi:hypothetical protein